MPMINIEDAYILDNTGQQVDDAVDYGLFNSNDNLLDNAYFVGGGSQLGDGIFPINQSGQTSYAGGGTTFDRWRLSSGGSMTLAPEGVSVNGLMYQKKMLDLTVGDTYTLSRKTTDGNIVSVTGIVPSAEGWAVGNQNFGVYFRPSTKVCDIQIWGEYFLQAIKLEKGTYSTLANDFPPDFGEQLEKCKRYLQRVRQPQGHKSSVGFGMLNASSNILRTTIPLSSPLRNAASITATATNTGQMFVWGNGSYYSVTGVTGRAVLNGNAIVDITVNGTLENYKTYNLILNDADAYIDLSAEL